MKYAKLLLGRLFLRGAGAVSVNPVAHAHVALSQGGLTGLCSYIASCDGDSAATILRRYGGMVGARPMIHFGLTLIDVERDFSNLRVGDGCHLGQGVLLDLTERITIADRATIAMRSMLITHLHAGESRSPVAIAKRRAAPIVVEEDAYVGAGAILLPGTTVGTRAIVAAGAVVTKDVDSDTVVAGVPARVVVRDDVDA
jgi:acetyltransferase-like isoleucine patch superfamily enzyme